ncbi:MAG TPA: energy transducer TonB [Saprospiraceae bacterium]|nr:energy transducer TonB [Saprospiraceae bacterium]
MLPLELSSQTLLLSLGGLCLLLILLIIGARWYLRKTTINRHELPVWSKVKQLAFDPLRHNTAFFQVGLITALALTLMAFNWTQRETGTTLSDGLSPIYSGEIEVIPPRTTTPPPVIPPPPIEIEEVPEEELPDEVEEFVDLTIEANDEIFIPESKPKPKPAPAPLPIIEEKHPEEWIRVEKMPTFPDCAEAADPLACTSEEMIKRIYKNLKYPAIARENNVEGTVVVSFIINESGKIKDIELLRDIGAGCGEVTLESVRRLQQKITFQPGMQQGRKVKVRYNIPIRFRLQ